MQQIIESKAREFAQSAHVSVLATVSPEGQARARVMENARVDDDFTIWYVTDANSPKMQDIGHQPHVTVVMSNYQVKRDIRYYGNISVVTDQAIKDSFWKDAYQVYFKAGKTDPAYVILKFVPDSIEYRDIHKYGTKPQKVR